MKTSMAVRIGSVVAAICISGSLAIAQPGPGGQNGPDGQNGPCGPGFGMHRAPFERALGPMGHGGHWWNKPDMVEKLKLTDEQRKAMDQILLDHSSKLIDLRGSVEKAELAMQPLMHEDQPNESAILAQIDKLAQARAELEKANARFLLAIRARLTPDQWKALQAARDEKRQQWQQMRPMRHRGPQGAPPPPPDGAAPADGPGPGPQSLLDFEQAPGAPDLGEAPEMPEPGPGPAAR